MAAYVICLTSRSGLPVFSRKKGNVENLPFSVIGSLNGVHMFGKTQDIQLLNTLTDDYKVAWREFEDSLVIVGISSGCTTDVLNKLIETIYNAIVLIVGIDEIKSQRNIERLKRELKVCYPIIDRLLDSLDYGITSSKYSSDIIGYVECILCLENQPIQTLLDSFSESVDSLFSCILIHGKIAAATESWWTLHTVEIKLLALLARVNKDEQMASIDIPVFLPFRSPTVAFRFVAYTLLPDVQVCLLCGPTPLLEEIERSASQCFKSSIDMLTSAALCYPRNFPSNCQIDGGILGLLLVNNVVGKYMISKSPQQNSSKKIVTSSHRLDILRTFFYQAVMSFLINDDTVTEEVEDDSGRKSDKKKQFKDKDTSELIKLNVGKETYWCSEYHKCHAMISDDNVLCVLYNSTTPTHAMRLITQKTLKILISEKQVCW